MQEDEEEEEILGSDDDEQEAPSDYVKGGYHPVKIGDLFHNRYHVIRKLGWGHFSTVKINVNKNRIIMTPRSGSAGTSPRRNSWR